MVTNFQTKAQALVKPVADYKKKACFLLTTGSDTEYVQKPEHPNLMITTQIALSQDRNDCFVFEHPALGVGRLPTWTGETILSAVLGWDEIKVASPDGYLLWESLMFFAPADLLAGLFRGREICLMIQRHCKQDARIRIDTGALRGANLLELPIYLNSPYGVLQVILKATDLGKLAVGGLEKTVQGFGGKMEDKGSMNLYKTNMIIPYTSDVPQVFQEYIEYGKDDACKLFFLRDANMKRIERLFGVHNLPVPEQEILTTGSLVAKLFEAYIAAEIGGHKAYELFKITDLKGKEKSWKLDDLLSRSTVKQYAKKLDSKKAILALVQGGRAKNEIPTLISQKGAIADIDLSSAYVSIQRALKYPVGLPTTYGVHESSKKKMKLGEFLAKHEADFIPGCWEIAFTGKLNHRQTLVPSKVIETIEIAQKYSEDNPKIPADFRLYTKEVINGVMFSWLLETLRLVCTRSEFKEWMDLDVVAAAWYPKSLRCTSPEEWYQKTTEHSDKYGNSVEETRLRSGRVVTVDNRSRYWLEISLESFLKPYADERKRLKTEMLKYSKGTPEYASLDAQQDQMKLVGNTLYGVLASPYFPISNVVTANNITGGARVAVWLTATALGCTQTITDGGAYDLNAVRYWSKKPGLDVLSSLRDKSLITRDESRYNVKNKPLASDTPWTVGSSPKGEDYSTVTNGEITLEAKEQGWGFFDGEAMRHVRECFPDLPILDVVAFEHKDIYVEAVYHSQTNYQFTHVSKVRKTKARGHKLKGKPYDGDQESNIFPLFDDLRNNPQAVRALPPQRIPQLLKCNQANAMHDSKTPNVFKDNGLLAGDSIYKKSWLRPLSLSMFHWETDAQYQSWNKTASSLKEQTGWGLEQYFLNPDGVTVNYEKAIKDIQAAIDNGLSWIKPAKGQGKVKADIQAIHPNFAKGV